MSIRRRPEADDIRHVIQEVTQPLNDKVQELEDENDKLRRHVDQLRNSIDEARSFTHVDGEGTDIERRVTALEQKSAKVMKLCQSIDTRIDDVVLIYQDKGRLDNLTAQAEEFKRQFYRVEEFAVRLSALEIEFKKFRGPGGKGDFSASGSKKGGQVEGDPNAYSLDYRVRMLEHKVNQIVKHRPESDKITSLSNEMRSMQAQFNQMNQSLNQVQFDDHSSLFNLSEYGNDDRESPEAYDRDDDFDRRSGTRSSRAGSPKRTQGSRGRSSRTKSPLNSGYSNAQVGGSGVMFPDNQVVPAQGAGQSLYPNGPVVYPNGSVVYPNGSVVHPSGPVVYPNGSVVYPNGPIVYPNTPQTFSGYNGEVTGRDLDDDSDSESETEPPVEHNTASIQITTQELNLISKEEFDDELAKLKDFLEQKIGKVSEAVKQVEKVCTSHVTKSLDKFTVEQTRNNNKFKEQISKLNEQVRKQEGQIKDNANAIAATNKAFKEIAKEIQKSADDIVSLTDSHKKLSETQRFAHQSNLDFIEKVNKDLQDHKGKFEKLKSRQEKDAKALGNDIRTVNKSLDDTRAQVQQQLLALSQRLSELAETNNRQFEVVGEQINQASDKIEANFERHERSIANLADRVDRDFNETYKSIDRVEQATQQVNEQARELEKDVAKLKSKLKESNEALAAAVESMRGQQKEQKQQFKVMQDAINQKCNDTIDICTDKIEDFRRANAEENRSQIQELRKQCEGVTGDLEKRMRQVEKSADKYNRMTEKHDSIIFDKLQPIVESSEAHINKANELLEYHGEQIEELLQLKKENAEMKEKLDHIIINQVHTTVDAIRKVDEGSSKRSPKYKPDVQRDISDINKFNERATRRN